jgi:hypothetical protein
MASYLWVIEETVQQYGVAVGRAGLVEGDSKPGAHAPEGFQPGKTGRPSWRGEEVGHPGIHVSPT